jgi:hypothetical protein
MRRDYLLVLLIAFAGCRRAEVTHFQVPKGAETAVPSGAVEQPRTDDLPAPPVPAGASALKWTLPRGWTEAVAKGVRFATLKPAVDGQIDISVVVLPGAVGGELAIVNRWRDQVGLPPTDDRGLTSSRRSVQSKAGPVSIFDFASEGTKRNRLVAALLLSDDRTWFVKMFGDEAAVTSARSGFMHLLESLRFDDAAN